MGKNGTFVQQYCTFAGASNLSTITKSSKRSAERPYACVVHKVSGETVSKHLGSSSTTFFEASTKLTDEQNANIRNLVTKEDDWPVAPGTAGLLANPLNRDSLSNNDYEGSEKCTAEGEGSPVYHPGHSSLQTVNPGGLGEEKRILNHKTLEVICTEETCGEGTDGKTFYEVFGRYGDLQCGTCQPGTFSEKIVTSYQSNGKPVYHPEGARRKCSICPQGFFQNEYGQNECKKCAFGRYQPDTQKTSCLACPAGQYSITPGTRGNLLTGECTPCRRDTYSADEGAISPLACTQCPVGFVSEPGSTECTATDRITTARPDYSRKVRVQYEMGEYWEKDFFRQPNGNTVENGFHSVPIVVDTAFDPALPGRTLMTGQMDGALHNVPDALARRYSQVKVGGHAAPCVYHQTMILGQESGTFNCFTRTSGIKITTVAVQPNGQHVAGFYEDQLYVWTMTEFLNGAAIPMVRRTYESNIEQVGWSNNNEYLFVKYGQLDRILFESFDIRTVGFVSNAKCSFGTTGTKVVCGGAVYEIVGEGTAELQNTPTTNYTTAAWSPNEDFVALAKQNSIAILSTQGYVQMALPVLEPIENWVDTPEIAWVTDASVRVYVRTATTIHPLEYSLVFGMWTVQRLDTVDRVDYFTIHQGDIKELSASTSVPHASYEFTFENGQLFYEGASFDFPFRLDDCPSELDKIVQDSQTLTHTKLAFNDEYTIAAVGSADGMVRTYRLKEGVYTTEYAMLSDGTFGDNSLYYRPTEIFVEGFTSPAFKNEFTLYIATGAGKVYTWEIGTITYGSTPDAELAGLVQEIGRAHV